MSRLIIVSNRLPFTLRHSDSGLEFMPSAGGLVSALSSYLQLAKQADPDFECLWVGWSGGCVPQDREAEFREAALREHGAYPVLLSAEEADSFYRGFCNDTLWPLFHYFPSYVKYGAESWDSYVRVNAHFRDAVLEIARPGDTVWVHD